MDKDETIEFVMKVYMKTLDLPVEDLEDFFEGVSKRVRGNVSEQSYLLLNSIETFIINQRMQEAHN